MPDLRRFRTRVGEELSRTRGCLDRLCGGRSPLHWPQRAQDPFMSALREALSSAILGHPEWADFCWQQQLEPRSLREFSDLARLPENWPEMPVTLRHLRRCNRVAQACLSDLRQGRQRRRSSQTWAQRLARNPLQGLCSHGNWHLSRLWYWQDGWLYTPLFGADFSLRSPSPQEPVSCGCGRTTLAFTKCLHNIC